MLRKPSGDKALTFKCICLQVIIFITTDVFWKKIGLFSLSYKKTCDSFNPTWASQSATKNHWIRFNILGKFNGSLQQSILKKEVKNTCHFHTWNWNYLNTQHHRLTHTSWSPTSRELHTRLILTSPYYCLFMSHLKLQICYPQGVTRNWLTAGKRIQTS